jgi:hypothetical protein
MKREIKFRAWDTVQNHMYMPDTTDWDDLHILLDGSLQSASESGYYATISVHSKSNIELMQYTGLPDHKRNDVYEGDILQSVRDKGLFNWVVCFQNGCFGIKNAGLLPWEQSEFHPLNNNPYFFDERIIIGNIYQHQNLLTQ